MLKGICDSCNPRPDVIVSRFEFLNSSQNGETVDVYLMKLRCLAERCNFGDQRDSLVRDKLLFRLDDNKTGEKLRRELDKKLSLDFVIKSIRVAEAAKMAMSGENFQPK